ncbi:hypothetical protein [Marinicella gelatinilytica]|nr:hypothetical protein [Marinicella gelatinilytica]MCX7544951.1 hypothetical protein [Marinicella gelatinilytica]
MSSKKQKTPQQRRGIKKTVAILGVVTVALFLWSVYLVLSQANV